MFSSSTVQISEDMIANIEHFIVLLYSRSSDAYRVNKARRELFVRGTRSLENIPPTQAVLIQHVIPPTQAALIQHVRRAAYQAGLIWGQSLVTWQELPSPGIWGWEEEYDRGGFQSGLTYQKPV